MDVAFQNWVIALSLGIVGGSLIGLVMGHKLKEPTARAIFSPMVFQSGSTNKVLVTIGFLLIAFAFFAGILQGIVAIVIAYVADTIVGTRVTNNNHKAGYSTVIKTILLLGLVIVLPVSLWGYHAYNRTPNDTDKASFVYDCSDYAANQVFKGDSKGDTSEAKKICSRLWLDVLGKYKTIGKINDQTRDGDKFGLYSDEVTKMYNTCVHEVIYNT